MYLYHKIFQTPHSLLTQPPHTRPDGTEVDYSACYDAFPDRNVTECDLDDDTRCVFCKQGTDISKTFVLLDLKQSFSSVHYASINIKEIIETIKANSNLNWDETVVIITSDNGAAPGAGGNGYSFGSAEPFRGRKSLVICIFKYMTIYRFTCED